MPEVYCITNLINGKEYVGQTKYDSQYRFKQHCEKSVNVNSKFQCYALYNAIRKYGRESFMVITLFQGPLEELDNNEIEAIDALNTLYPNGYNMTPGGHVRSGPWLREESKEQLSNSKRTHRNYNLPRHICELNHKMKGFRVSMDYASTVYEFVDKYMTMEQKLMLALDCLNVLKSGKQYKRENKSWISTYNNMKLPDYITYKNGSFQVRKPTYEVKVFVDLHESEDKKLELAINYLNSLA